jgi:ABC-type nitrate/sulfonate/bicarbonate transport system substrate-binding protein
MLADAGHKRSPRVMIHAVCAVLITIGFGLADAADKVRIGYTPNWSSSANLAVALDKTNICSRNSLECELVPFAGGVPQLEAILADKLDLALVGDAPAAIFAARGGKGKFVARLQDIRGALIVRKDASFKSLADLRGKKVGGFMSSGVYATMYDWMERAGINPTRDVTLVNLKPGDWVPSLRSREIDAFIAWEPIITVASFEPDLRILNEGLTLAPGIAILSDKFASNRDAAVRLMVAYNEAILYMATHKGQVNRWLSTVANIPTKTIEEGSRSDWNYANAKTIKDVRVTLSQDDIAGLQKVANVLASLKQLREAPAVGRYVDMSYVLEANKRLEKYDPSVAAAK